MNETIHKDIIEIKKVNDGSLSKDDFDKILEYYGPAVLATFDAYSLLRGKELSYNERYVLTYLAGTTGLFDDLFDDKKTSDSRIFELINKLDESYADCSNELFLIKLFNKALVKVIDKSLLKQYSLRVFDAQIKSREQINSSLSRKELKEITDIKGGVSLLFYRVALAPKMTKTDENMLYNLGAIIQLENDIFDIYEDYQRGISTLATVEVKISRLRSLYLIYFDEVKQSLKQSEFPENNKRKFYNYISLIICRGLVCLDQLEKNEKLTGGEFKIDQYSRKQLVCDMEKPKNILKTLKYYSKYSW